MNIAENRRFRLGLLITSAVIGIQVVSQLQYASADEKPVFMKEITPLGSPTPHDTGGTIPGNPAKTLADTKRLFQMIQIYRSRHNGQYPDGSTLHDDMIRHTKEYGFGVGLQGFMKAEHAFDNPDTRFSDSPMADAGPSVINFPFIVFNKRPNGAPVGGPKAAGTRDVLAYTDLYVHMNTRIYKGDRGDINPVGFYIVLWDDGQVQKVPYDKTVYVLAGSNDFNTGFVGQAGTTSHDITWAQLNKHVARREQAQKKKERPL